jgi:hypothetical protein
MRDAIGCPSCGHLVVTAAGQCWTCGHRLDEPANPDGSSLGTVLAMVAAAVLVTLLIALLAWAITPLNEAIAAVFQMVLARFRT